MRTANFADTSVLEALEFKPQCMQSNNGRRCTNEAVFSVTYHEVISLAYPCWNEGVYLCDPCISISYRQLGRACHKCQKKIEYRTDKLKNIVRI